MINHARIDRGIDLNEIERIEIEAQVEARNIKVQIGVFRPQRMHRIQPFRLQHHGKLLALGEFLEFSEITVR